MGANDTAEALAVCHEVNVANEARITELETQLAAERATTARLRGDRDVAERATWHHATARAEARIADLETALAEADRETAELTTALADRMRTDAHGVAAAEADLTSARERLARISALVDPRRDDWSPLTAGIIRRIVDETTAEPWGAYLDLDEARLAERACRHSAASIRAVNEIDPDRLHPDVLPYADRLDTLADRLAR